MPRHAQVAMAEARQAKRPGTDFPVGTNSSEALDKKQITMAVAITER